MKKGFTLLEVLVALIIISSSLLIIFQIFSQGFTNIKKVADYQDLLVALSNLKEEITSLRYFEAEKIQNGKIGPFDYEWKAVPASTPKRMTSSTDTYGPYIITLYRIEIIIYIEMRDGRIEPREFTLLQTGWNLAQ